MINRIDPGHSIPVAVDHWMGRALRGRNPHSVATVVGLVANGLATDETMAEYPQTQSRGCAGLPGYAA